MARAPTARGCDACRKQKKKCDEAKPACSRCARLKIHCVGSGQRRFIFKQEHSEGSSASDSRSPPKRRAMVLSRTPSDETFRSRNAFINLLEITDSRFSLSTYGDFLVEIPRRMGRHPALDAAVNTLTVSYACYHKGERSTEAVASYLQTIKALKSSIEDPSSATASETLCAMYMCLVCEGWRADVNEDGTQHVTAMTSILNASLRQQWRPGFEAEVLTVMCMPVVLESLFNPHIDLEPWIWRLIDTYEPIRTPGPRLAAPFESLHLRNLAQFAIFTRSPARFIFEIQGVYQQMCQDVFLLHKSLDATKLTLRNSHGGESSHVGVKALGRIRTAYCFLLTLASLCNCMLAVFGPPNSLLKDELELFCTKIINNAEQASEHRPFGATAQPFGLVTALVASENLATKLSAQRLIAEYQSDFPATDWSRMADRLREKLMFE